MTLPSASARGYVKSPEMRRGPPAIVERIMEPGHAARRGEIVCDSRPIRREPFIQTVSGGRFNPFAPDEAAIDIDDIAQALGNLCRFGGHCRAFYSVAQHSCHVADAVGSRGGTAADTHWALLHDAAEAYLGDLPHPIKQYSPLGGLYRDAEARLQAVIYEHFGLSARPLAIVKEVDRSMLAAERRALMLDAWAWPELTDIDPIGIDINPWPPKRAAEEFRARHSKLSRRRERE
jgi:hypothetical protein